ncbi:MAG TPA: glycine cleavage system protein H [Anaerolineales bacterium]|nr:glycine cleavage system protein H [Anaerolineales bacterium]
MLNETNSYEIPADRAYDREHHMWAQFDRVSGGALVGIDTLGLASLGDLAYVTLKDVGKSVKRGESIGTLEAAKMTGDLIAPISGVIVARNDKTMSNPALVNQSPYVDGWMVVIKPSDWENESAQLVSGDGLPAWVESEIKRYRNQGWID